jgi:putative transposase
MPATPSAVIRAAKRNGWKSRKRESGKGLEYAFASLPVETQNALIARDFAAKPLAEPAETALAVIPETQTLPAVREPRAVKTNAELKGWQREIRDARALVLALVDDLTHSLGTTRKAAERVEAMAKSGTLSPIHAEAVVRANARNGGARTVSAATLYRWLQLRAISVHALAPDAGPERDQPAWIPYFLELYQDPAKPSIAACLRRLRREPPPGVELPSERSASSWINDRLPKSITQYGRMGTRARRAIRPFTRRTTDGLWPMDIVAVDGHAFKGYVAHPASGKRIHPEVTTYVDIATRRIVGFSVWVSESAYAIWLALRQMVLNPDVGIPAMHYSDNGAYKGEQHRFLLDRLGITQEFSRPGNPQANGVIERINRTLWLPLAKQLPLYSGKDMDKEAFKRRKDRADKTGAGLVGYADFVAGCAEAVAEYNAREHSSLRRGRERLSPNAAWARAVEEGWQPTTLDSDDLHDLLPSEVRTCLRCEVALPWGRYFSLALEPYEGQRVHVGYEPSDNARAWISDQDGRLICVAELGANQRAYQPTTAIEKARENRGTQKVKRLERRIERARAEETSVIEGQVLEGEASDLPYLGFSAEPSLTPALTAIPSTALDPSAVSAQPEPARVAAELPKARPVRSYIDELDNDASRYEVLKTLRVRMAAGDALTERERQFFTAFGTSEYVRITEKLQADWDARWAQTAAG